MSGFSAEYLAQIEQGMTILSDTSSSLDVVEQLLEQEPTSDAVKNMVKQLSRCADFVKECREFEAIMPHDSDEKLDRYIALSQRAGRWVEGAE